MKVAVITPYYKEPRAWLERCLGSVREQRHAQTTHFVVADGHAQDWIDQWPVRHIRLDKAHGDYGNTPRAIGGLLAASEGYDAVCFLDADNWYGPGHVESCVEAAAEGDFDYVVTARHMVRDDGSIIPLRIGEDADGSHVDTNCYCLLPGAYHTLSRWALMPRPMAIVGDRVFLSSLKADGLRAIRTEQRTVFYLCTWSNIFRTIGEAAPPYAKEPIDPSSVQRWYAQLDARGRRVAGRLSGVEKFH